MHSCFTHTGGVLILELGADITVELDLALGDDEAVPTNQALHLLSLLAISLPSSLTAPYSPSVSLFRSKLGCRFKCIVNLLMHMKEEPISLGI